jgi:hypothetical protein
MNRRVSKQGMTPLGKFVAWGCLTPIILLGLFLVVMYFLYTPFIEINETEDRIALFNDSIVFNGSKGLIKIGDDLIMTHSSNEVFEGELDVQQEGIKEIRVKLSNSNLKLKTSDTYDFRWNCQIGLKTKDDLIEIKNGVAEISLNMSPLSNCEFEVPVDVLFKIRGHDSEVIVDKMSYDLSLEFKKAYIVLKPDPMIEYEFDIMVFSGHADTFISSQSDKAYKINISLDKGKVLNH